ncbi:HAMP domain-containing sensor histidine kinase [Nonomuraea sp. NPDC049421]|uniref:sensor histidine kinase n=1 Tax=Nonomuraea sp. NPDC049421 TaxID=3155275 RepID=UPI003430C6EE
MTRSWKSSIRARYTVAAAVFSLIILGALGATLDLVVRNQLQTTAFDQVERVASQWSATARGGVLPRPIPAYAPVELIQVVDARHHVVDASKQASSTVPLSWMRPPPDDRFQHTVECRPEGGCLALMAIRLTPEADAGVVYAARPEAELISGGGLELGIGGAIAFLVGLTAYRTWTLVGRTLRPVEAIRSRISEITVSDLSLRVPVPHGNDEIAQLATTANQTLARLEDAVEQQRRFASTTSHELRTPIAGLRTQLEEAVHYPGDIDPHETIRNALASTDRLEAIVDDLLQLARLRQGDPAPPEPVDLGELTRAEVANLPHRVPIAVEARQGVVVRGSRVQLARVLNNLLANAQRHAGSGVDVSLTVEDGQAVLAVTDDGPGVPPAHRERVFERFVRLDDGRRRDPGGSGLGLAISRDIAHTHYGSLRVEDSPAGARFVLRLPLARPAESRPADGRGQGGPAGERLPMRCLKPSRLVDPRSVTDAP